MGLLYRLFRVGRMPQAIKDEIAGDRVLFQTEGIHVVMRRSGRVPGSVVASGVNVGWGGFAVTDRRIVGSRSRAKLVDVPVSGASDGPATLTLDDSGLHVAFDLDRVHPSCSGSMRLDFHATMPPDVLARLPLTSASFRVDPQKVVRMWGSLRKLPSP